VLSTGASKKAKVSSYKGRVYVDIREYYVDKNSAEELPGKKGITLDAAQWEAFKEVVCHRPLLSHCLLFSLLIDVASSYICISYLQMPDLDVDLKAQA
jgi:hypothetical protein